MVDGDGAVGGHPLKTRALDFTADANTSNAWAARSVNPVKVIPQKEGVLPPLRRPTYPHAPQEHRSMSRLNCPTCPEVLELFDQYVHGASATRLFDGAARYAAAGASAAAWARPERRFRTGAAGGAHRRIKQPCSSFPRRRATARCAATWSQPANADGQAAGGAGGARKPRPQSAHRGHRAPPGARGLHRLRAGRAVPAGRLSRRRGQGARRCSRSSTRPRRATISSPRRTR